MADSRRWPFVKKVGEWSVMPPDRRRKQFPHRVAITWSDATPNLAEKLQEWAEFCTNSFGPGTRDTFMYMKKTWQWTWFTSHSRTEQITHVIFAFRTDADLLVFKMGVMHG